MFNKKLIAGLFVAIVMSAPLTAKAVSIEDLQAQISSLLALVSSLQQQLSQTIGGGTVIPTPVPTAQCENFTYNLYLGKRDNPTNGEVSKLQRFLTKTRDYNGLVGGYFGPATERAVQSWQRKNNVVRSGTPDSTGYGVVGPTTRGKMRCGSPIVVISDPVPSPGGDPNCKLWLDDRAHEYERATYGALGNPTGIARSKICTITTRGGSCSLPPAKCLEYFDEQLNQPPTIHSFSGPTELKVGEIGTWKIKASDPENGQLTYDINWGDRYTPRASIANSRAFTQETTFTHSYSRPGTYTVQINVRNSVGKVARTTSTVRVEDEVACTREYRPICGLDVIGLQAMKCAPNSKTCGHKTYPNKCELYKGKAKYLYEGKCTKDNPTLTFSATPQFGNAPLAVKFTSTKANSFSGLIPGTNMMTGIIADGPSYRIDFGDGTSAPITHLYYGSKLATLEHTYTASGTYTANLIRFGGYCAGECPITTLGSVTVSVLQSVSDVSSNNQLASVLEAMRSLLESWGK